MERPDVIGARPCGPGACQRGTLLRALRAREHDLERWSAALCPPSPPPIAADAARLRAWLGWLLAVIETDVDARGAAVLAIVEWGLTAALRGEPAPIEPATARAWRLARDRPARKETTAS